MSVKLWMFNQHRIQHGQRGGARNMKYKGPPMAAIFFMTSFNRDRGGGHGPLGSPPRSAAVNIHFLSAAVVFLVCRFLSCLCAQSTEFDDFREFLLVGNLLSWMAEHHLLGQPGEQAAEKVAEDTAKARGDAEEVGRRWPRSDF